jgi:hypothetical protein
MSMTSRLASFVRNLVRRDRVEHDLDEELRAFVEQTAEEKQNAGLSPKEARRAALIDLGGMEQVKERVRDARSGSTIDQLARTPRSPYGCSAGIPCLP